MDVLLSPPNEVPARVEPLAKLPVFWALEGRQVAVWRRIGCRGVEGGTPGSQRRMHRTDFGRAQANMRLSPAQPRATLIAARV